MLISDGNYSYSMLLTLLQSTGPGSFTLPGTFEMEDAVPQAPPREFPPSLSSVSKTLHSCKVAACCVVKCFSMLEVFPPFDVITALRVLQLALVFCFLVKYNQTLERFCLDAMLETFRAKIRSVHMTSSRKCVGR